jgi:iron-sulfur cluster assembly protein
LRAAAVRSGGSPLSLIEVTEPAAERIRQLLEKEGKLASHALRMKVVGGGCSGLRYELAFDDRVGECDTEVQAHGVRLVVDEKSALYLVGTTLDFVDTLNETGFKMKNPNAATTCGCGESFGA